MDRKKIVILGVFLIVLILIIIIVRSFFAVDMFDRSMGNPDNKPSSEDNNIYSKSIKRTRDTERRSGASLIAFVLKAYQIDKPLPTEFPTKKTCIGTKPPCYDLTPLLVPDEVKQIPSTPDGTAENTGYFVWQEDNEVVISAKGELEENIEVRK